jgi:hypothetical protein
VVSSQLDRILPVLCRLRAAPVSRSTDLLASQFDRSLAVGARLTTAPVSRFTQAHGISS